MNISDLFFSDWAKLIKCHKNYSLEEYVDNVTCCRYTATSLYAFLTSYNSLEMLLTLDIKLDVTSVDQLEKFLINEVPSIKNIFFATIVKVFPDEQKLLGHTFIFRLTSLKKIEIYQSWESERDNDQTSLKDLSKVQGIDHFLSLLDYALKYNTSDLFNDKKLFHDERPGEIKLFLTKGMIINEEALIELKDICNFF